MAGHTEKKNQDAFFNNPFFCDRDTMHLFGVCDGHGLFGHQVSQAIADLIPLKISEEFKSKSQDSSV